ncbi:MAG: conjugative transfer signal peptidase TraF [Alphaproteobacteria bacterium]|nr:conjugative transfer signal peptidase TraF [Alphaproteobacteria bacterium]
MRLYRDTRVVCLLSAIGVAALAATATTARMPILVWNATASAPIGLYLRLPKSAPKRGDLVLVRPPVAIAKFASRRGYLPLNVPLIKRISALSGDAICARDISIFLNKRPLVRRQTVDGQGRSLPRWLGCHTLTRNEVFLAMTQVPDSFDGRYFGAIPAANIVGRLVPLWTW